MNDKLDQFFKAVIVGHSYVTLDNGHSSFFFEHDVDGNVTNHSTIDVITKNCFANYDFIACARSASLGFISFITALLCVARIVTLHLAGGHSTVYCNYILFFCLAAVQSMLGTAEWVYGWTIQASLATSYLRSLGLLVLCYTYMTMAFRLLRRSESVAARVSAAGLSLCFIYFTFFIIMAYVYKNAPWFDCYANFWLFLSTGQMILIQIVVFSSLLILSKVRSVTADVSLQRFRRRGLWLLIGVLEISAVYAVIYHLCLFILANESTGCSGVFLHRQAIYTPFRTGYEIFVYLLPIWGTLYVFMPVQRFDIDHEHLLSSSSSSSSNICDPAVADRHLNYRSRTVADIDSLYRSWRFRVDVLENGRPDLVNTLRQHQQQNFIKRRRVRMFAGRSFKGPKKPKRTRSAPSVLKKNVSPTLETIPEETSSHSSQANSPPRDSASLSQSLITMAEAHQAAAIQSCSSSVRSM